MAIKKDLKFRHFKYFTSPKVSGENHIYLSKNIEKYNKFIWIIQGIHKNIYYISIYF